jgi:6-pyruvoyltetrahydropterin/6-carboxytetrahydropterin synthase
LDHRMILHREDPARMFLEKLGEPVYWLDANPTAENIAKLIFDFTKRQSFPVVEVRLWETPNCFAAYNE